MRQHRGFDRSDCPYREKVEREGKSEKVVEVERAKRYKASSRRRAALSTVHDTPEAWEYRDTSGPSSPFE